MNIDQLPTGLFALLAIIVFALIAVGVSRSRERKNRPKDVEVAIAQVDTGISNEEIAAIMAAVSAMMTTTSPGASFRIASITRDKNSAWRQAGQIQNIQSF